MTYKELLKVIESMPKEWLDKEVQAIGSCMAPTSAYLGRAEDDILQYYDKDEKHEWPQFYPEYDGGDPLWYKKDLSERHLKGGHYRTIAKKGEYFIILDD